jgi:CubicO group peptidase (beta-lactamase class C family)
MKKVLAFSLIAIIVCSAFPVFAQDVQLDAAKRNALIEAILKNLNEAYVFPEVAKKMEQAVRERIAKKEYDALTSPSALAATLTANLQEVSHDKHLRIMYRPGDLPSEHNPGGEEREMNRAVNYGFDKVQRLEGNIGYLELRGFQSPEWAADTAAAAMNFLANTDALIIDLRNNGGGSGEMVALLIGYLLNKRTHVNSFYWRPANKITESWTPENLAGKRYGEERQVYVLTSRRTFSAAEEFSYDLQNLKRATIVGETTGGGAHPVEFRRLTDGFAISLPAGRAINPITKTNWEGTGVKPDIAVPAEQALKAAQLAALKTLVQKATNPRRDRMQGLIASLQKELDGQTTQVAAPTTPQPAAMQATEEVKLPDTPAGKTIAAFLQTFNTGDLAKMKRFHTDRGDTDENAEKDFNLYNQTGGFKLISVADSSQFGISILVEAKKDARRLFFSIEVQPSPPHAIDTIRLQPASEGKPPATRGSNAPPPIAPVNVANEAEALKAIESLLDTQAAEDRFSGAILIAKNGKPLFKKAYGVANKITGQTNRTDTKFNLGSMNKMFTAVAVAQLAEQGKLSFDDKVGKYLPDYPNADVRDKVTIHQLLTHTAGLGSYWNKRFDERRTTIRTVNDYLSLFAEDKLLFEPGARFQYSNSGFIVLGAIIEKVSAMSYYDYVREHIYKPAGMSNTDAYESSVATPNLAMGYTKNDEHSDAPLAKRKENTDSRPNRGGPAGGGYSTVEDLVNFANALTTNRLLSAKYTALVTTSKVEMGPGAKYAYGFGDIPVDGKRTIGHNGGAPGISADLSIFTESGYTVAMMANYDPEDLQPIVRQVRKIIAQLP